MPIQVQTIQNSETGTVTPETPISVLNKKGANYRRTALSLREIGSSIAALEQAEADTNRIEDLIREDRDVIADVVYGLSPEEIINEELEANDDVSTFPPLRPVGLIRPSFRRAELEEADPEVIDL